MRDETYRTTANPADEAAVRRLYQQLMDGWNRGSGADFAAAFAADGMIIVGDAAHAASPASGQGASMAIEDAVVLAKCLRDLPDIQQASPPTSSSAASEGNA